MPIIHYTDAEGRMVTLGGEFYTSEQEAALVATAAPSSRMFLQRALAAIRARSEAWEAAATPAQRAIGPGSWFLVRDDADWGIPEGMLGRYVQGSEAFSGLVPGLAEVTVYGRVYTRNQFIRAEQQAGADRAELRVTLAGLDEAYEHGWRICDIASAALPGGQQGMVHVALMEQITEAEWMAARRDGWPAAACRCVALPPREHRIVHRGHCCLWAPPGLADCHQAEVRAWVEACAKGGA